MIDRDKVIDAIYDLPGTGIVFRQDAADLADAAIAAVLSQLREPSEAMIEAAWGLCWTDETMPDSATPQRTWQTMIDAAFPAGDAAAALARTKHAIEELAATLDEVDAFRDAAKPQPSADALPDNPHTP